MVTTTIRLYLVEKDGYGEGRDALRSFISGQSHAEMVESVKSFQDGQFDAFREIQTFDAVANKTYTCRDDGKLVFSDNSFQFVPERVIPL